MSLRRDREFGNHRHSIYVARRKVGGWYGRRFGKNPKYRPFPQQTGSK